MSYFKEGSKYRIKTGAVAFISCIEEKGNVMFGIVQGCSDTCVWDLKGVVIENYSERYALTKEEVK